MITLYSGTPGSGKSLHLANKIWERLRLGRAVVANFDVNLDVIAEGFFHYWKRRIIPSIQPKPKKPLGRFDYVDFSELTVSWLREYARRYHRVGKEGQTLLVIDECAVIFNSRAWDDKQRKEWVLFFQQHRKLGYNVILVSQSDRLIDRQIRAFIEYDERHRALQNYGTMGWLLSFVTQAKLFLAIVRWYGINEMVGRHVFMLNRRHASIYDTFELFERSKPARLEMGDRAKRGGVPISERTEKDA